VIEAYRIGQAAWPELSLDEERFTSFVRERAGENGKLEEMRLADLYLVCACLERDPKALRMFETRYLPQIDRALAHYGTKISEDTRHALYAELVVGDGDRAPKLASYGGRGSLEKWLRVTAIRRARDLLRQSSKEEREDEGVLMDAISPDEDVQLAYMKRIFRSEFKAAFQEALASLGTRERNILRHQILDQLTADQVAAIYRVHRITVVRWNKTIREKLFHRTRKGLVEKLQIDAHEVASITRMIQSHFDVSLRRYLERP
jgi:RNA polymerase sigma-70 factor (ECF subfamily)